MPVTKTLLVKKLLQYPDNLALRELLIGSLSEKEKRAYLLVIRSKDTPSTRCIAENMKISIQNAGNILLRLYRFKLIERHSQTSDSGLFYVWKGK